jgi:hypothetical protein
MNTELAVQQNGLGLASAPTLLETLAAAARDPQVDAGKIRELLAIKTALDSETAQQAFNRSMLAAQREMPAVLRDSKNEQTNSKYAKLEKIEKAIRPVYMRHGFVATYGSKPAAEGLITVYCKLLHTSGEGQPSHIEYSEMSAPPDSLGIKGTPNKTPMHGLASTVRYLQRYLLCMMFNIILTNEDTDGNPQPVFISDDEAMRLEDMITDADMTPDERKGFLAYMRVETLSQIPQRSFTTAFEALKAKKRKKEGK